ncbi:MAG: O-antigen ligase C-terminal domain-containing protein [Rhodoferax sp.]|nr:O-antigen ligase C-terminal domain-containing protein [Rhodoferax sp.]
MPIRTSLLQWTAFALTVAFLVPNHYPPWLSFHSELVAAVAFVPIIIWAGLRGGPLPAISVGGLLLAAVALLQTVAGQIAFSGDGWMAILYLTGFALAALAGARLITPALEGTAPAAVLGPMWAALAVAGHLSLGVALQQWLQLDLLGIYGADLPPGGRVFGNLAQPNQLATLLLMGVTAHVALFEARQISARVAVIGVLFLTLGLVMTGSRTIVLALAWLWPAYLLMRRRCELRTHPIVAIGLTACFFIGSLSWPALNEVLLLASDVQTAVNRLDSPGIRSIYWHSMLEAICRSPWVGYGWNQIGFAQTATALDFAPTFSFFYSSHSLPLDLLLWNGLPVGLVAIAGLAAWAVWQTRRCQDSSAWPSLVTVGIVFSHAMVEYPLNYAYFLLPVGLLMGSLSARYPSSVDLLCARLNHRVQKSALMFVLAMGCTLLVKVSLEYPLWERDWRNLRFQEATIGEPMRDELPTAVLLTQLSELMRFSRTDARPGMTANELEWMRLVSGRFGHSSGMFKYALALAVNGQPIAATQALRRLCSMHPRRACSLARKRWADLGQGQYPVLHKAPFPVGP